MEFVKRNPIIVVITIFMLIIAFLYSRTQSLQESPALNTGNVRVNPSVEDQEVTDCVPTFRDGGGPYYLANSPFRANLAPRNHNGEKLTVEGKVLRNDCQTPVADAILDVWQANESGNYEDAWYRGQVRTDSVGSYSFETVIPKGYGEGTGYRPPHIHFKVFENGTEIVTSQMFFPEVKGRQGFDDAYIMDVDTEQNNGTTVHFGHHDIILP